MALIGYVMMVIILVICGAEVYYMIADAYKEMDKKALFEVNEERCESKDDEVE